MQTFRDKEGAEWEIRVNVGVAIAVQESHEIDLLDPNAKISGKYAAVNSESDLPLFYRLFSDGAMMARVLSVIVRSQLEKRNVSVEDFYNRLDGETMLAAESAFRQEYLDFFQQWGRTAIAAVLRLQQEIIQKENREKTEALLKECGVSPDTSEQTRDPLPSGNLPQCGTDEPNPNPKFCRKK